MYSERQKEGIWEMYNSSAKIKTATKEPPHLKFNEEVKYNSFYN